MWPGAAVCGLYFSHPQSAYFGVGKIERDQVEDYARRKGWSVGEAREVAGADPQLRCARLAQHRGGVKIVSKNKTPESFALRCLNFLAGFTPAIFIGLASSSAS